MAYIGHSPTNAGTFYILDDLTMGSGTTYGMAVGGVSVSPTADNLLITLDGVIQHPGDAYTVSGSNIVFASGPGSGVEFYGIIMGQSASTGQGSIGADELKVSGDGTSGQVLTSDGDGTFSWATDTENYLPLAGGTMSGAINLGSQNVTNGGTITGTFVGNITGNVTGNTSGTAATVTGAAQSAITSVGTLTSLSVGVITQAYSNSSGTDYLDGDAGLYIANSGSDGTMIKFGDTNAGLVYGSSGTGTFKLMQRENTALSFDASRNATFAGNITQSASGNLRHTITAGGSGEASLLLQANNSTGDSFIRWETNATTFCMGFDNSDGDKFILSAGSDPHSNSVINIQPDGSSIAIDKPLSFTDVVTGETNSHISYTAGQGTDTVTGGAFRAPGSDMVTGRIFFQGYQNGATDLVGINNESDKLVVYNYTDNAYMLKFDHGGSADFTGNVGINGDRYMLMESDANKGYLGKDDWATSGGSADNINLGCYGGQVKITAGSASSSTSNIVCLTDKSTHFNSFINVEGDVQHKASSGSGVTVYKTIQKTGTYSGDVEIVCTASGWKSFIYDLCVIGHGGGGHWRGFAYHNTGITHGYQSVANNNGGVSAMSLTTSGQSMTFTVPLSSVTHILVEFRLSSGAGDLIPEEDIAITID